MKMKRSVPLPDVEKINIAGVWAALPYTRHPSWSPQLNYKLEMRVASKSNTEMHWKIAIGTFVFFFKSPHFIIARNPILESNPQFSPYFCHLNVSEQKCKAFRRKDLSSIDSHASHERKWKKNPPPSPKKKNEMTVKFVFSLHLQVK